MPLISALNLVLAAHPSRPSSNGVMVGANKFFHYNPAEPPSNLGGALQAWRGFYASVRPAHKQLMVNVNVCTTAFYTPGNLVDRWAEFEEYSKGGRPNAFMKGIRVRIRHLGHVKTVKAVSTFTAANYKFDSHEYGMVTVLEYFRRSKFVVPCPDVRILTSHLEYQITIQHRDLPLIDVGGQNKNLIPMELCDIIEKQPYRGKLTDDHTAAMIKVACRPPNVNANAIVNRGLDELGYISGAPHLQAFGVDVGRDVTVVPGRILPPPNIRYGVSTSRVDDRAAWNMRSVKFAKPARLQSWAVLLVRDGGRFDFEGRDDPALLPLVRGLANMCRSSGMGIPPQDPPIVEADLPRRSARFPVREDAIRAVESAMKTVGKKPALFLVVLSNKDRNLYNGIKKLCDVTLDVATVCVRAEKFRQEKGQSQYFANVALKFNMKAGGVNHMLDDKNMTWLRQWPTMLVGMDVTHPGLGTVKGTPSIAAVVANVDDLFAQFPASLRMHESKKEVTK